MTYLTAGIQGPILIFFKVNLIYLNLNGIVPNLFLINSKDILYKFYLK